MWIGIFVWKEFVCKVFRDFEYFNSKFQLLCQIVCLQLLYQFTWRIYSFQRTDSIARNYGTFSPNWTANLVHCIPFLHALVINLHNVPGGIECEREISTWMWHEEFSISNELMYNDAHLVKCLAQTMSLRVRKICSVWNKKLTDKICINSDMNFLSVRHNELDSKSVFIRQQTYLFRYFFFLGSQFLTSLRYVY